MISLPPKHRVETYEEMRARLIAETSNYLTECLRHPELAVRIYTIQAGHGRFPPSLGVALWTRVLGE